MKKFYTRILQIIFFNFSIVFVVSQTKTYTQSMDSLLVYLDKSQMMTPILYDRVFSFTDIDRAVKDTVSSDYFVQSWSELYRAHNNAPFLNPDQLKDMSKQSAKVNNVEIGLLNLKFDYLNFGDQNNPNININDGYFRNVPGKNPFSQKTISIAAPIYSQFNSGAVTFSLKNDFVVQDESIPKVTSINVDIGNGTTQTFQVNGFASKPINPPVVITYTSSGKKNLKFTLIFSDNTTKILYSSIDVNIPQTGNAPSGTYNEWENFIGVNGINNTIPFQGYGENSATSGKLEYRTYYNTISNPGYDPVTKTFSIQPKLRNPVYILDGYDPGDKISIDMLYGFMAYDIDNIPNNGNEKNLIEDMRDNGFDVTLVNFPNGADFIERNAMAVVALLQRENLKLQENGSSNQIALIGPSMGGLVSRYALAYMEKNNIPHNTRLWVSYDAPHLGANIPISAQSNLYFYGFLGGNEVAKTKYSENFFSPAAREMLIEQLDAANPMKGVGGQNNGDPVRNLFRQNLINNGVANSNGFPQLSRNIAISNGNTDMTKNVNDGQCLLEMAAFKKILGFNYKAATLVDYALPSYTTNALNFEGKYTKTGWFTNGNIFSITILNTKVYRTNNNFHGSMDAVQGSKYNTMMIMKESFEEPLNQMTSFHEWRQGPYYHTFMPTVSTLSLKNPNFNWNDDISRNLLCNNEIPFNTYFVTSQNDMHVAFDQEIANWLSEEIKGNFQSPHLSLKNVTLSATKTNLCVNETFHVQTNVTLLCNLPSNYYWTVSNNLQLIGSNTSSVIEVKALQNGYGFVELNFDNGQKVTQKIWVGASSLQIEPASNNTNYVTFYAVSSNPNLTLEQQGITSENVKWKRLDNGVIKTGYSYFANAPGYNWSFDVEVKATNSCGTYTTYATISPPPPVDCTIYKLTKNGNSEDYSVSKQVEPPCPTAPNGSGRQIDEYQITVANSMGVIVISKTGDGFDMSGFPTGMYVVNIQKDNQVVINQTIIKN